MPMDFYQGTDEAFMEHCNMKDSKLANLLRLVLGEDLVEVEANPRLERIIVMQLGILYLNRHMDSTQNVKDAVSR